MAIFRIQEHVPDVYPRKSRDFQLFCNLFDCLNGGIKYDIDSILDVVDTNQCNERLIPYLQTKLGFFTNVKIPASHLRIILKAFPYIVRNKGSIKGVEWAVQTFLKIRKIDTPVIIRVDNSTYTVYIGTEEKLTDTEVLEEILKYVLPAGYELRYIFYTDTAYNTSLNYADVVDIIVSNLPASSIVKDVENEMNLPKILDNVDTTPVSASTMTGNKVSDMEPEFEKITADVTRSKLWE